VAEGNTPLSLPAQLPGCKAPWIARVFKTVHDGGFTIFDPQNTPGIPAVKIFAFLDHDEKPGFRSAVSQSARGV